MHAAWRSNDPWTYDVGQARAHKRHNFVTHATCACCINGVHAKTPWKNREAALDRNVSMCVSRDFGRRRLQRGLSDDPGRHLCPNWQSGMATNAARMGAFLLFPRGEILVARP